MPAPSALAHARRQRDATPPAQAAAFPSAPQTSGPHAPQPEADEVKAICPLVGAPPPPQRPVAPGGQDVGGGSRAPPQEPRGRCQGESAGLCVLALLENRTKPREPRMSSLTMAVPTEKAAIRQAMPRGRQRRRGRGGWRRGPATRTGLLSLLAPALRPARARAPAAAGSGPAPAPPRPARAPPTPRDWPASASGRGRQVRVLLFCSCWGGGPGPPDLTCGNRARP